MSGVTLALTPDTVKEAPPGVGAFDLGDGRTTFRVWAPFHDEVSLHLVAPVERYFRLQREARGYHAAVVEGVSAGARYFYRLSAGLERPDPASRFQPLGVHGPSEVIDPAIRVNAPPPGRSLTDYLIYELHTGLVSREGTFEGAIPRIPYLVDLGVTAVELMPIAAFPGTRNWGYDGVYPFAVQSSYGGPAGLAKLVDACHEGGLSVVLDVVYNHLGPEGNYLRDFGPYFTNAYKTPWGTALNFDGPYSDEVRRFFIESALYYIRNFEIDAFRIDAVHSIVDNSAQPFLQGLAEAVHTVGREEGREIHVIAESDLNNAQTLRPGSQFGLGFNAQWADDFHHSLHALVTGEQAGYYGDFGSVKHLERALTQGYVYTGQYSEYRKRSHGNSTAGLTPSHFVVCSQNHDQTGNRALGDRLSALTSFEGLKLAAGAVLLSPFVPLLFMGEEYGEDSPFLYFTSHADPAVVEGVRRGRLQEFIKAHGSAEGAADPQAEETFERSRPRIPGDPAGANGRTGQALDSSHQVALRKLYQTLIRLRRELPGVLIDDFKQQVVRSDRESMSLGVTRSTPAGSIFLALNFGDADAKVGAPRFSYEKVIDSAAVEWLGPGSCIPDQLAAGAKAITLRPQSFILYKRNLG